jgi:hypothetical protein
VEPVVGLGRGQRSVRLRDRGVIKPGAPADIMIFDPDTIGPWKKEFVHDLPGNVGRFKAWGQGVQATIVNGHPIVLLVEHPSTGGYPKIANVVSADIHALGQLRPRDAVRFEEVSFDEAVALLREREDALLALLG